MAIDSDATILSCYAYFFQSYFDYELAGLYSNMEDALADFDNVGPDLIISEVNLSGISALEGISQFKDKDPEIQWLVVSNETDFDVIKKAFANGANGYLTKPVSKKRLLRALNSVRHEGAVLSNDIAGKVISMFQRKCCPFLSERENQIVELLAKGSTYKAIADKLFVTTSTISFHLQNIYVKLDVNSKSEALQKLRELDYAS